MDNLAANKTPAIRRWAKRENVELCLTPTNASWANPIEAHSGTLRIFVIAGSSYPHHPIPATSCSPANSTPTCAWRSANARHSDVLTGQRCVRARARSEKASTEAACP